MTPTTSARHAVPMTADSTNPREAPRTLALSDRDPDRLSDAPTTDAQPLRRRLGPIANDIYSPSLPYPRWTEPPFQSRRARTTCIPKARCFGHGFVTRAESPFLEDSSGFAGLRGVDTLDRGANDHQGNNGEGIHA